MCRELTCITCTETHPFHALQLGAVQFDGSANTIIETASEGQALEVRAALDKIRVNIVDNHLADIRKHGAFTFELGRNGGPVADAQQFQPSEVWQPNWGVDELLHQVFWGIFEAQVHRKNPRGVIRFCVIFGWKDDNAHWT